MKRMFISSILLCAVMSSCADDEGALGESGYNSLVRLTEVSESESTQCEHGGVRIETGLDLNRNDILEPTEVLQTHEICAPSHTGQPGQDGEDGVATLFISSEEAPGEHCEHGGIALHWGPDLNGDGCLTINEVTDTEYLCHGGPGKMTLAEVRPEDLGGNCTYGGLAILTGVDLDEDGLLDDDEVLSTAYLCNTAPGKNSLVRVTDEAEGSLHCPLGGVKIQSGLDLNENGVLDDPEVQYTQYVCER